MTNMKARNQAVVAQLPVPYQSLYLMAHTGKLPYELQSPLMQAVARIRRQLRIDKPDPLLVKSNHWGNDGSWGRDQIRQLQREIFKENSVAGIAEGDALSVEIECIFPNEEAVDRFVKEARAAKLRSHVCVKSDGSIHPDDDSEGEIGREIVVSFSRKDRSALEKTCELLTRFEAYVNTTCGLHVHFDMRNRPASAVNALAARLAVCVPNLKKILPESRRNNSYCRLDRNSIRSSQRYAFINASAYRKHRTLEVRGHGGSISARKINYWIDLLTLIMNKRQFVREPHLFEMLAQLDCPAPLYDYCKERYVKFEGWKLEPAVAHLFEPEAAAAPVDTPPADTTPTGRVWFAPNDMEQFQRTMNARFERLITDEPLPPANVINTQEIPF